jgi:hypothetical protein
LNGKRASDADVATLFCLPGLKDFYAPQPASGCTRDLIRFPYADFMPSSTLRTSIVI